MKRFIPTLILVAVCIVGFVYASSQNFWKTEEEPMTLIALNKDDVVAYTSKTTDEDIHFKKEEGQWAMTEPAALPVNSFSPGGWVDQFVAIDHAGIVEESSDDLEKYGFNEPILEASVTLADGTTKALLVGKELPVTGFHYAKLADSPTIYRLLKDKVTSLSKTTFDYLEKSPVRFLYTHLQGMEMEWLGEKWSLYKADPNEIIYNAKWKLGDKELTSNQGASIVDKLLYLSTDEMVLPAEGIEFPGPQLRLVLKEGEPGKEKDLVYLGQLLEDFLLIKKEGGDWIYIVPAYKIEEIKEQIVQHSQS